MTILHKPLRDRPRILGADVADAIEALVGNDLQTLPIAFDKNAIVAKLVQIAHTAEDGVVEEPTAIAERSMSDSFLNRLTNTAVFQSGYKRYENKSRLPLVPVTDFFFRVVYANGDTEELFDAMTMMEIRQSLPKRRTRVLSEDAKSYMHDQNGDVLIFGELAGVVIFPANSQSPLLRAWLARLTNTSGGALKKTVDRIEHARPHTESVANLKTIVGPIGGAMKRALPRPRREDE